MKIAAVLTATAATTTAVSGNLLRDSKTAVQKENDRRLTNSERRLAVSGYSGHRLSEDAKYASTFIQHILALTCNSKLLFILLQTQVFDKTDPTFHPDDLLIIPDYWLIGIRTSYDDTYVAGVDDAGKVEYNYPWCTVDETSPEGYTCLDLGPWNCSGGMTWTECCDYAKADVTDRGIASVDLHGNSLDCYDSPPPISEDDPEGVWQEGQQLLAVQRDARHCIDLDFCSSNNNNNKGKVR